MSGPCLDVIPVQTGIHDSQDSKGMDSRLRGNDFRTSRTVRFRQKRIASKRFPTTVSALARCHPRADGDPGSQDSKDMDSRLRGNDFRTSRTVRFRQKRIASKRFPTTVSALPRCHPRADGDPVSQDSKDMDSRLRGNDTEVCGISVRFRFSHAQIQARLTIHESISEARPGRGGPFVSRRLSD